MFEMIGQTASRLALSVTSIPRINGAETMHQPPKCVLDSVRLFGPMKLPTSSMSWPHVGG